MQPGLQAFIAESRELLDAMEDALLRLENAPGDAEALNAVFRAAHTIKGSAGVFEFDDIVAFTHSMESVLVEVRAGDVHVDATLIALLLSCGDHCSALVACLSSSDPQPDDALRGEGDTLIAQLEAYLKPATRDLWHLSIQFGKDVLRNGMDPLSFIRYLGTLASSTRSRRVSIPCRTRDRWTPSRATSEPRSTSAAR